MKDVALRLLSELMKNGRRSDRELAKAIGVSQPTITRTRNRLEKEKYIKEYTIIPDLAKIGFELMALTFLGYKAVSKEDLEKAEHVSKRILAETYDECIFIDTGIGLGYEAVIVSLHKDYSSYSNFMDRIKQGAKDRYPFMDTSNYKSFLVALRSDRAFRSLTLSTLAKHLLASMKEPK